MTPPFTKTAYAYVGPVILALTLADSTVRRFRGRVVRHEFTGAYRFYVNRTSWRRIPKGWPSDEEFTDDFDMKAVKWLGKRPASLKAARGRRLASRPSTETRNPC